MSTVHNVDVAILGAGTAGLSARRAAKANGASVVMIDPGPFGTTCARVGCMPSKLLIAAAEAAHHVHQAPMFGVNAAPPEIDGPAVMRRVQSERDRFVCFVGESIDAIDEAGELIRERATVMGPG
ncbi:MAG: dihydrolipoamide dehydrogenase, partial [bacterium]